ncbi:hypothetical protein Q3G72_026617 [Acer saccharum]|nr:hypothetical protein Q3G72_026617 [Acer saccharum]
MARLTPLAAILATVLLLVANTYAIRTTIPTVEIAEATNPVEVAYEPMCRMEMRWLDDECHCEALGQLLIHLKIYGGEQVDMEDAEERAKNIPVYCNLKERCRIHIV